jgi:hypothetical protein
MYTVSEKISCYHGTYPENIDGIINENFKESINHDIWIGDGVYFFVDGIGEESPVENASQYAIDNCYDKTKKDYLKDEICVLEAKVKLNNLKYLDLTQTNGLKLFNSFRSNYIKNIEKSGKYLATNDYKDADIFKIMREELEIEFVKSDVYIRFASQRKARFDSRIPNVTIFVVNNPKKNIIKPTIKVIYRKAVK